MKIGIVTALVALGIIGWGLNRQPVHSVPDDLAGPEWISFSSALQTGDATGRPTMVFVYADWCGWCRKTFAETFTNPAIIEQLNQDFQVVKLNTDSAEPVLAMGDQIVTERDLSAVLGATALPTYVFLSAEGKPVGKLQGFYAAEDLSSELASVSE